MDTKYSIVARYRNGRKITGYLLRDLQGNEKKALKEDVYALGKEGRLYNASIQKYNGEIVLRGNGFQLSSLPEIEDTSYNVRNSGKDIKPFNLSASITSGRSTVGYVVSDLKGNTRKMSRHQVIELAELGKINNARVQKNGEDKILRGVGININELPKHEHKNYGKLHLDLIKIFVSKDKRLIGGRVVEPNQNQRDVNYDTLKQLAGRGLLGRYCKNDGVTLDSKKLMKLQREIQ